MSSVMVVTQLLCSQPKNVSAHPRTFGATLQWEYSGIFWNIMEYSKILQDIMEYSRSLLFHFILEYSRMLQNIPKY